MEKVRQKLELEVLSSMLYSDSCLFEGLQEIKQHYFKGKENAYIFSLIDEVYKKGVKPTLSTLEIQNDKMLKMNNFSEYIQTINENRNYMPMSNFRSFYLRLKEFYILEQFVIKTLEINNLSLNYDFDNGVTKVNELKEFLDAELTGKGEVVHIFDIANECYRQLEERKKAHKDGRVLGITSGLSMLDKYTGGFRAGELIIIAARPGIGKEQPLTSNVLTTNGWKEMGKLKIGDEVVGGDGLPCKITGVFPQGNKEVYRVTFSDGYSCECGLEHLWNVKYVSGKGKWHTKSLKEILSEGLVNKNKYRIESGRKLISKFEIPITKIHYSEKEYFVNPYVMGVLIGDGSLMQSSIYFSNPNFDIDIAEKVSKNIPENYELRKSERGKCPQYIIAQKEDKKNGFRKYLLELGLCVRSSERFIPECYMLGSYNQRLELLKGLMDTDGSISINNSCTYSTSSFQLAKDIVCLIQSLGGIAKIRSYNRKEKQKTEYVVSINTNFNPFYLSRKANKLKERKNFLPKRYIESVEKIGYKECQCISVSNKDGLYVTDNYIVTHNTALALHIAKRAAEDKKSILFFSLEMNDTDLVDRLLLAESGVDAQKYKNGNIDDFEMQLIKEATQRLSTKDINIDDKSKVSIPYIRTMATLKKNRNECDLIIVDYLQLADIDKKGQNREREVANATRDLKLLSKELNVPIILLSQLNREVESEKLCIPKLAHLRESGAIEQDADIVLLLTRPAYYKIDLEKLKDGVKNYNFDGLTSTNGLLLINIAKHRKGKTGFVFCRHNDSINIFSDL